MAKRLFLHVGMPKCATTTIQAYLAQHVDDLAVRGFHYQFAPGERLPEQGNASHLATDLIMGATARAWQQLDFFLRADGDVILSSEYLFGVSRGGVAQDMVDRIRQAGFDVAVICYLRRQDLWIESDYKQHVKSDIDWRRGIVALLEHRVEKQVLNYNAMLMNWARFVGQDNVLAVPLRPEQPADFAVRRFLEALGIADMLSPGDATLQSQNVSPPTGLIEPARYLKRAMLDQGLSLSLVKEEVERMFRLLPDLVSVPQRRFLMTYIRRQRLLKQCERSNDALAHNFLGGNPAFDMEPEHDEPSETPLGAEAAAILAAYHVNHRKDWHARSQLSRGFNMLKRSLTGSDVKS